jgi:hypothetical protein
MFGTAYASERQIGLHIMYNIQTLQDAHPTVEEIRGRRQDGIAHELDSGLSWQLAASSK